MPEARKTPKADQTEFLELAMERFKLCAEAESDIREKALDDLKFYSGEQWDDAIQTIRKRRGRPCLKMNHLPQFKRQICNEQRQNKPAVIVNPIGDEADVETAEVWQGIVRHVEVGSNADIARDISFEQMVVTGFGYRRLITEYTEDGSGEQEIKVRPIKNQFTVYFYPLCLEPDYSDQEYGFIVEDVPRKLFESENRNIVSLEEYESVGDTRPDWVNEKFVRIAEYFYVEKEELEKGKAKRKVKWAKITAQDVLDERDWPGTYIPIIPVFGEEMIIDGKRVLKGFVRDAKDPQRQYNFMHSGAAEAIAIIPKAPYIVVVGQIEGLEAKWEQANVENFPYLEYNQVDVGGKPAPPPQRSNTEANIQGYTQLIALADNDLKASIGIYDASLGQRGPEQSGKAIAQRKAQGDIATLNYSDNLARSILLEGKMILDLGRVVYNKPRIMRIIKPDDSVEHIVTHNGADQATDAQGLASEKISKVVDIGTGRYDVAVQVGPSYQSKRQEAVATQLELVKADPQLMQIGGDIIVRNMDIPQAGELADRIKMSLPQQFQDQNSGDPKVQLQNAKSQLMQMGQQFKQASDLLNQAHQIIQTKQVEQQGKVEIAKAQEMSKVAIVKMQEMTKLAVAQINASKDANQTFAEAEMQQYAIAHDSAHEVAMTGIQQDHEKQMAQMSAENAQQTQASDQAHAQQMAEQQPEPANA